jgi:hypothetical protein
MDLKNAATTCLIALFSATLVVLIARAWDSQVASRLEPQLANIVEELRALRAQGGVATAPAVSNVSPTLRDGLVVYYFHSNVRCPTCRAIESQTAETVQTDFAKQVGNGELVWKIVNYEQSTAKALATLFEIQMPVVVLARMKEGQVENWKRLDEVWPLVGDKPAFAKFLHGEIQRMLSPEKQPTATPSEGPTKPASKAARSPSEKTPAIPIPK